MIFNEDSRVKTPSILHLMKLGYTYLSLKNNSWDASTIIFTELFYKQLHIINPELSELEIKKVYDEVSFGFLKNSLCCRNNEKLKQNK